MPRLTRAERSEQIRRELIAVARDVFLARGFHGASLEEISERAGYTRGAVYSNFDGKEGLFLAVLDEHGALRVREIVDAALDSTSFESGLRACARALAKRPEADRRWMPVLVEFWTHASHRPDVRKAAHERHERALDAIAATLAELAAREGVAYRLPVRSVARGHMAFVNGWELEQLLDATADRTSHFQEMFCSFVLGLVEEPRPR